MKKTFLAATLRIAVPMACLAGYAGSTRANPPARARDEKALQNLLVQGVFQQHLFADDGDSRLKVRAWDHETDTDKYHLVKVELGSIGEGSKGAHYALHIVPYVICWALDVSPHTRDGKDGPAFRKCQETKFPEMFSRLFGKSVVVGPMTPADPKWIPAYDSAVLQTNFDRFYLSPSTVRSGVPLQKLYDTVFKDAAKGFAETLLTLSSKDGQLEELTRGLIAAYAKWDPAAGKENPGYLSGLQEKLKLDARLLGTILRREADGTLPTVVGMLLKVLEDYDPKEFALVDAPLRAANFKFSPLAPRPGALP